MFGGFVSACSGGKDGLGLTTERLDLTANPAADVAPVSAVNFCFVSHVLCGRLRHGSTTTWDAEMKIHGKILSYFESCNSPVDKEGYLNKKVRDYLDN